jgi:toxin CcdB
MARFGVYRLSEGSCVLDCQADLLSGLTSRFVVPLVPLDLIENPVMWLNPQFDVGGEWLVMMTQFSASVDVRALKSFVLSLHDEQDSIMRALDMLIVGF